MARIFIFVAILALATLVFAKPSPSLERDSSESNESSEEFAPQANGQNQNTIQIIENRPPTFLTPTDFAQGKALLEHLEIDYKPDHSKEIVLRQDHLRNGNRNGRWPGGVIPYEISSLYTSAERSVIAAAMQEYHSKTCVRFVPRTSQTDYIHITPDDLKGTQVGPYCYSYVGRIGGRQIVKMYNECVRISAMIHELGHVIGFDHEHNRSDRDSYINVQFSNIDPVFHHAFNKVSASTFDNLGYVYDYYSIMHYGDYSYAKPGTKSYTTRFPGYDTSGENQRLSPTDVAKFNKYNGC